MYKIVFVDGKEFSQRYNDMEIADVNMLFAAKVKNMFFGEILEGKANLNNCKKWLKYLEIDNFGKYQAVIVVESNFVPAYWQISRDREKLLDFSITNIIGELLQNQKEVYQYISPEQQSICLVCSDSLEKLDKKIKAIGKLIIDCLEKYLKVEACIIVGESVDKVSEWSYSLNSARRVADKRYYREKAGFLYAAETLVEEERNSGEYVLHASYADEMVAAIKRDDVAELHKCCRRFFEEIRKDQIERTELMFRINHLIFEILAQVKCLLDFRQKQYCQKHKFFKEIYYCRHITQLENQMKEFLDFLLEQVVGGFETEGQRLAKQAREYIETNCHKSSLSLEDVCKSLQISPSYLSLVYKNETGETFVETMTRVRIERAKAFLLDADSKNYEIAERVGFRDVHYFSTVFKKYTGMTPTRYSKQVRNVYEK